MVMVAPEYTPSKTLGLGEQTKKADVNIGSRVVDAAGRLNAQAQKQASQMVTDYNGSRVRESYNDFRELARQKFQEFKSRQGRDAIGSGDEYREWYDKESGLIEADLDNAVQQQSYNGMARERRTRDLDGLSVHEANELQRYRVGVHQSEIAHAHADVMLHFNDDARMKDVEQGITDSYERTYAGLDTDASRMKDIASLRSSQIQLVAEDNPDRAEELLKKYKSSLGQAYKSVKAVVAKAGTKKRSQRQADLIMSKHDDPKKQLKSARAIGNSEVRDATVTRIKTRQEETKKAVDAQRKVDADNLTGEAMDVYLAGGNKEQFLDLIDETEDGKIKKDLVTLSNTLYGKPGDIRQTDYEKVHEATDEIDVAIANGEKLTDQYLLRKYKAHMKDGDYEQLLKYNNGAFDKKVKHDASSAKTQITEIYNRQDFGPTEGKNSKNAKRIKADLLLGLHNWMENNPNRDPQEYVDTKVELVAAEEMAKGLNTFWENLVPGQQEDQRLKAIGAGEHDDEILERLLRQRGKNPASYSTETLEALKNTPEFSREKTKLLGQ